MSIHVVVYLADKPKKKFEELGLTVVPPIGAIIEINSSDLSPFLPCLVQRYGYLNKHRFKVTRVEVTYGDGKTNFNFNESTIASIWIKPVGKK